jgi:putative endonuclease
MKKIGSDKPWFVYIARCRDATLYSGVTTDVARRIHEHNHSSKCRYTRSRKPITLVYRETCADRGSALRREAQIKSLGRQQKFELIENR